MSSEENLSSQIRSLKITVNNLREQLDDLQKGMLPEGGSRVKEILDHIPTGVAIYEFSQRIECLYTSEGIYPLLGYSKETFHNEVKYDVSTVLTPEDAIGVRKAIEESLRQNRPFEYTYRSKKPGGKRGWTWIRGQQVGISNGHPILYTILLDVTKQKETEMELAYEKERYRILEETEDGMLFDYNVGSDTITLSLKNAKKQLSRRTIADFLSSKAERSHIHPDYRKDIVRLVQQAATQHEGGSYKFLYLLENGTYAWHKVVYSSISNHSGEVTNVFGKISNVHRDVQEELRILERANLDPLTNVFNRTAMFERIQDFLSPDNKKADFAYLLLDIDDFKSINDTFGHSTGDSALLAFADILRRVFIHESIVGRFGGDEFNVFLKHISRNEILKLIEQLFELLNKHNEQTVYQLHCSIGAVCGEGKEDHSGIFQKADVALYHAKRHGKNKLVFFSDALTSSESTIEFPSALV